MSPQEVDNSKQKSFLDKLLEARNNPLIVLSGLVVTVFMAGLAFKPQLCALQFRSFCDFKATIDNLKSGEEVKVDKDNAILVKGTLINTDKLPSNTQFWLIVRTHNDQGVAGYYPQAEGPITPLSSNDNKYDWEHKAIIGQSQEDNGKKFDILVVAADSKASKFFEEYVYNCHIKHEGCFSDPPLPEGAEYFNLQMPIIQVIRKSSNS